MSNIELFLDRHRISWEHNIDRQLNPPRKFEGNPILEGEHPWEASFVAVYGNVLPREGGGFRIWYHAGAKGHQSDKMLCYAESDDGFNWKRIMVSDQPYGGVSHTYVATVNPNHLIPINGGRTLNRHMSVTCGLLCRETSSIGQTQLRYYDAMKAIMIHLDRFSRWPSPGVTTSSLDFSAL